MDMVDDDDVGGASLCPRRLSPALPRSNGTIRGTIPTFLYAKPLSVLFVVMGCICVTKLVF